MVDLSGPVGALRSCPPLSLEGKPEWAKLCAEGPGAPIKLQKPGCMSHVLG